MKRYVLKRMSPVTLQNQPQPLQISTLVASANARITHSTELHHRKPQLGKFHLNLIHHIRTEAGLPNKAPNFHNLKTFFIDPNKSEAIKKTVESVRFRPSREIGDSSNCQLTLHHSAGIFGSASHLSQSIIYKLRIHF